MPLLGLLETVLIVGILFSIVYAIVRTVPMPPPWPAVAYGVLAIIVVIVIFSFIGGLTLPPPLRLR